MNQIANLADARASLPPHVAAFIDSCPPAQIIRSGGLSPRLSDEICSLLRPLTAAAFDRLEAVEDKLAELTALVFLTSGSADPAALRSDVRLLNEFTAEAARLGAQAVDWATGLHERAAEYATRRALAA